MGRSSPAIRLREVDVPLADFFEPTYSPRELAKLILPRAARGRADDCAPRTTCCSGERDGSYGGHDTAPKDEI